MHELEDEALMLLVGGGSAPAFNLLVQRYRRPIYHFIYRFLGEREAAEDLSQDTFVRLWSSAANYQPSAKFTTFLYLIARNLCLDYLQKYRRLPPIASLNQPVLTGEGGDRALEEAIPDTRPGPEGEMSRRQLNADIEAAIQSLPEEQRLIFVLTELQGLSYQRAAEVVGCPMGTVASRKNAAVRALRDRLTRMNGTLEGRYDVP